MLAFVEQIGAFGSYLESSIQEQLFHNWQGTGLSTIQVFLDANAQGIPLYVLNAANAPALLSRLQLPAEVLTDIRSALAVGLEVVVPERAPAKPVGVSGIGYRVRDPQTGSASYRISGGTDGGDGEAPCAEPQRRPLTESVRNIVLTAVLLAAAIAAIVWAFPAVGGAIGGLVTGGAKPAIVAIMAGLGLTALTFSATAGGAQCNPIHAPRRGGDPIHDPESVPSRR